MRNNTWFAWLQAHEAFLGLRLIPGERELESRILDREFEEHSDKTYSNTEFKSEIWKLFNTRRNSQEKGPLTNDENEDSRKWEGQRDDNVWCES